MNKKEFPIILLRNIADVLKTARLNKDIYADLIDTDIVDFDVTYRDKDKSSNFYFSFFNPTLNQNHKSCYDLTIQPHHTSTLSSHSPKNVEVQYIKAYFNDWIKILQEYDSINLSQEDEFVKQYQEEYFEEWKIVDEDADEKPFDDQQQTAIFKLLEYVATKLKEDEDHDLELTNIIQETESLKANIQNLTKNAVVKGISKIFARIKKKGLPLLFEVLKEVKKEVIKKVITEGFEIGTSTFHQIVQ